jgi:Universal stress protein family
LKILIAIDDSQCSEAVTRTVVHQMRPDRAEVRVLHVVEPIWLAVGYELGEVRQIEAAREQGLKRDRHHLWWSTFQILRTDHKTAEIRNRSQHKRHGRNRGCAKGVVAEKVADVSR